MFLGFLLSYWMRFRFWFVGDQHIILVCLRIFGFIDFTQFIRDLSKLLFFLDTDFLIFGVRGDGGRSTGHLCKASFVSVGLSMGGYVLSHRSRGWY